MRTGCRLGDLLIKHKILSKEQFSMVLAEQFQLEVVSEVKIFSQDIF